MQKYTSDIQPTEDNTSDGQTGWIVIPSKENDPEHFEENVEKLKILSHDNWCTKTYNAEPYLEEGDFHVYLENGKPKIGIRFIGDEIEEIQGEKNDGEIPLKYLSVIEEQTKDIELTGNGWEEFENAYRKTDAINDFKAKLRRQGTDINNCPPEELFNAVGIKAKRNKEGKLILDCYRQPEEFSYEDLGINENKLFKDIVEIKGDADFEDSKVTSLGNLRSIGGHTYFKFSNLTSLDNLESIGGFVIFEDSKITSLGNLRNIGGDVFFKNSEITSLDNLESIGGSAYFGYSNITSLGNLRNVGGDADFRDAENIKSLNNITVNGNLYIDKAGLLAKVKHVGKSIIISSKRGEDKIYDGDITGYIQKFKNILHRKSFKLSEVVNVYEQKLSDSQLIIYDMYIKEGIDSKEAAYQASFTPQNA